MRLRRLSAHAFGNSSGVQPEVRMRSLPAGSASEESFGQVAIVKKSALILGTWNAEECQAQPCFSARFSSDSERFYILSGTVFNILCTVLWVFGQNRVVVIGPLQVLPVLLQGEDRS